MRLFWLSTIMTAASRRTGSLQSGPHLLTYRQIESTARLVVKVLSKPHPDGRPSPLLSQLFDALLEASVSERYKDRSSSLAIDWTDYESFSTRRTKATGSYADPEASWGHRKGGGPGEKDELFFGYYLSLGTMVKDEGRWQSQSSCDAWRLAHLTTTLWWSSWRKSRPWHLRGRDR